MTRPLNANRSAYRALLKAAAIARHARLARAVARAEKAVVRAAVALRKARYRQPPLSENEMRDLRYELDFRVEQLWEAQARAKKGRSKK